MDVGLAVALGLLAQVQVADTIAIQRTGLAYLAEKFAGQESTVSCVWATPPAGRADGLRAPSAAVNFREPLPAFLERVPTARGMRLVSGSACEGGLEGVRESASGLSSRWFFIETPGITDSTATLHVHYYCGGKCAGEYELSIVLKQGVWTVAKDQLLSIS